jgi:monovalent cation:H+ antiporter-2, CPA2 family
VHLDNLISDLALILIVAGVVTLIFRRLKLPIVLGYIVAGFLISPHFVYMPTVVEVADIEVWANIGVVFLMFGLGLEFSFKKLATVGGSAVIVAMTVMIAMIFIGAGVGYMLGWSRMDCIFLGGMLSMSSTMIILKAYEEYDLKERRFAQLVLSTLVIEDIAGIFMMIILSTISVSQGVSGFAMFREIGLMLMYLVIWLILGIYLIPSFLKRVSKYMNDELMVIVSLSICLGMVVIANFIGFSEALGAFMAGSILAGTVRAGYIERLTNPIKDLFGAVFFVSVGMMIQPDLLVKYIGPILLITAVTIVGQMTFATLGILLSGQSLHTAIRGGLSMVQIGEFSFIIATLGSSLGVISDFLYPIVVCVSVITTFTTPLFINHSANVYKLLDDKLPDKLWVFIKKNTSEDRSNKDKDEDWFKYLKQVLARTIICSIVMYIIYWLGIQALKPFIDQHIPSELIADLITAAVTCGVMVPFISLMHGRNDALFVKLWLKQRSNKLPLLTLKTVRIFIGACFVALVLRRIYHTPFIVLLVLSAAAIILIIRSEYIKGVTINMELRFMENFSERTLAKQKRERGSDERYGWLNEELLVAEFQVTDTVENKTIYDFTKSKAFRVTIIKIIRGDKNINLPTSKEVVLEGDILHMMGTSEEIDACTLLLEKDECIEYTDKDDITLKDYIYGQTFRGIAPENQLICCPINVGQGSEFSRKSIKNSHMREKYRGTIIGIERGNLTILNVDVDTIIQPGDLIWTLGGKQMADFLIKGNVLESI